jgi:hypothetical protein
VAVHLAEATKGLIAPRHHRNVRFKPTIRTGSLGKALWHQASAAWFAVFHICISSDQGRSRLSASRRMWQMRSP